MATAAKGNGPAGEAPLTEHELRILALLAEKGTLHRRDIVWELASPDSKIGRARETGSALGGGSSGNGEALIMGRWSKRLRKSRLIREVRDERGYYVGHALTDEGRLARRNA
jgi:hypothetical protein